MENRMRIHGHYIPYKQMCSRFNALLSVQKYFNVRTSVERLSFCDFFFYNS